MKQGYLEYKESGYEWLGEIPLHWELKKAKWSFKEKSIKGYPDELLLSVSKGKGVIPRGELENKTVMAFKDLQNFKLVLPEDFVIHLRSFQSGFEMSMNKGIVSPAYTVFSCKNGLLPSYYKFLFYMQNFIDAIASTTQSLRDGKPIAYRDFSNMVLPFPKYNEQVKIANFLKVKLKEVDNLIYTKKKLILLLEQQRQSIITEAVTKGLNPNVKMKDSGVEWIGEIPEHWEIKKIKNIANVYSSNVDKKSVEGEKEVLLCNYVDVYYNDSITADINFMKATAKDEQIKTFKLKKHDVIITKDSESPKDIAIPTWVSQDLDGVVCGYHLSLIRCFENTLGHYLYYTLESNQIKEQFYTKANGVTRFGLSKEAIKNGLIAIPPFNEQLEIAKMLNNVNQEVRSTVEKLKIQIEKLKEYRQALIYEAVTGKIDVRDMELDEVR
ncbi:restriction endonuclease subunit S [Bacillus altitudinis]|uniref:restriction endonuclease subunit S n=1 Tax=Bacillus altitudinis TaxID=293387 RepID=UPI0012F1AA52|nr:restriction endonuclease subunit S [Bacillus altitudinis]VXC01456.1 Type I restriction-modification system, specificity subunit S [Bacillus altitudinis]